NNTSDDFEGVKYIDDETFSLTISKAFLPSMYELSIVSVAPLNEKILTDNGKYDFKVNLDTADNKFDPLDKEYLGKYVLDTFKSSPKDIAAGPYNFVEYKQKQFVKLEKNEHYIGDSKGNKPKIDTIIVKVVSGETDVDQLIKGDLDIVEGQIEGAKIQKAEKASGVDVAKFPRNGYGYLAFHTDMPIVSDVRVRQAIGYLIDRDKFISSFLGGPEYGVTVDSTYGLGSWEAAESPVLADKKLVHYQFDLEKAVALLEEAGWKYDAAGQPYTTGIRHNEKGEILELKWLSTEENRFTDVLNPIAVDGFDKAGIKLTLDKVDFASMYTEYQKKDDTRKYHMFNLASSIPAGYSPYSDFTSKGSSNNTNFKNAEMDVVLESMKQVENGDKATWISLWDQFITINNRELPLIPLYSNTYHHIYRSDRINGYTNVSAFWGWPEDAINMELKESK
ncbi:MAG: ABC transporter substrate-binding protein, partial [Bacilli bacterium]